MNNIENITPINAVLAAVDTGEYNAQTSIDELEELARTAGAIVVATVIQKKSSPDTATCLGEGKLEELKEICENNQITLAIFDCELTASQIRNIEAILDIRVIDRTMLILDIFAARAISGEGKLQVELAQLKYRLPRLAGIGNSLSRLGGGIGTRGPGETQLETDKRHIRSRIDKLTEELRELEKRRNLSRVRRKKDNVQVAAIVGYTNAGKSTLLNSLTGADVLAEDKLFATLDPTSRGIELPDGRFLVVVDTVGLIRRLPHHLVEAFKSTLEEAANADIILHVADISDNEVAEKMQVTEAILNDLGAGEIPVVNVLNKADLVPENAVENENTISISALNPADNERLLAKIAQNLPPSYEKMQLLVPYDKAGIIAKIRINGKIISEDYRDNGIACVALVDFRDSKLVKDYAIKD